MLSISSGWLASTALHGSEVVDNLAAIGARATELTYHTTESMFEEMKPRLHERGIAVSSVHSFFPAPDEIPREERSGELYLYTSDDPDERHLAVKYTVKALEIASELEARAVVLHLGHVPMIDPTKRLKVLYDEGKIDEPDSVELVEVALDERRSLGAMALDHALICLDELNKTAERLGILIGIENRYHLSEVPNFEELSVILSEFPADSMVRYWHDVGHSVVAFNLGYGNDKALLDAYGGQLAGMHLHDVVNGHKDHQPPGSGEVDWGFIKEFAGPDLVLVMELSPSVTLKEAEEGLAFLDDMGFGIY